MTMEFISMQSVTRRLRLHGLLSPHISCIKGVWMVSTTSLSEGTVVARGDSLKAALTAMLASFPDDDVEVL
jgi:hypothetical protein